MATENPSSLMPVIDARVETGPFHRGKTVRNIRLKTGIPCRGQNCEKYQGEQSILVGALVVVDLLCRPFCKASDGFQ